jgi:hypothetical protein
MREEELGREKRGPERVLINHLLLIAVECETRMDLLK